MNRQERIEKVQHCLNKSGVNYHLKNLEDNTATAQLAAEALSCPVACIAKSILFRAADKAVLAVLCGDNRVNVKALSNIVGKPLKKADAAFVQTVTGFEIGGVPPIAHVNNVEVILEKKMQNYPLMWAAAGSAYTVFGINPNDLATVAIANFFDFAE